MGAEMVAPQRHHDVTRLNNYSGNHANHEVTKMKCSVINTNLAKNSK